jgi:hypothetical protein
MKKTLSSSIWDARHMWDVTLCDTYPSRIRRREHQKTGKNRKVNFVKTISGFIMYPGLSARLRPSTGGQLQLKSSTLASCRTNAVVTPFTALYLDADAIALPRKSWATRTWHQGGAWHLDGARHLDGAQHRNGARNQYCSYTSTPLGTCNQQQLCCDKATSPYISLSILTVDFTLIVHTLADIYLYAFSRTAFQASACAPHVCCLLFPSDGIRRCDSHYIPPYSDDLVGSDQIIRLGRRIFPYSSTPAK